MWRWLRTRDRTALGFLAALLLLTIFAAVMDVRHTLGL